MQKNAQIISILFHPVFVPLWLTVIFVNSLPFSLLYTAKYKIVLIGTIAVFTCIIPLLYLIFKYLTHSIPDIAVFEREKRTPIYIVSFLSYIICVVNLANLRVEPFFLLVFVSSLVSVIVIFTVNLKWKISAHSCGTGVLCGAVFAFARYLYGNPVVLLCGVILVAGSVMTSRLFLKAHTFWQVIMGFLAGLLCTVLPVIILYF
jgi:hypothetical protein